MSLNSSRSASRALSLRGMAWLNLRRPLLSLMQMIQSAVMLVDRLNAWRFVLKTCLKWTTCLLINLIREVKFASRVLLSLEDTTSVRTKPRRHLILRAGSRLAMLVSSFLMAPFALLTAARISLNCRKANISPLKKLSRLWRCRRWLHNASFTVIHFRIMLSLSLLRNRNGLSNGPKTNLEIFKQVISRLCVRIVIWSHWLVMTCFDLPQRTNLALWRNRSNFAYITNYFRRRTTRSHPLSNLKGMSRLKCAKISLIKCMTWSKQLKDLQ